jgi:hypothetical protein
MQTPNAPDPMLFAENLPRSFDFYHLGSIELESAPPDLDLGDDRQAIAYTLHGDATGVIVLIIDSKLDRSTYAEAGNLIASSLADSLAQRIQGDILPSPPRSIEPHRVAKLAASPGASAHEYFHRHDGKSTRITVLLVPDAAHATNDATTRNANA